MSVFDELMDEAQPGYEKEVRKDLLELMGHLGEAPFVGVSKADFAERALDVVSPDSALLTMLRLGELNWWCGLPISNATHGRMAAMAREIFGRLLRNVAAPARRADPAARRSHAVFAGAFGNALHSPSRGAVAYARTLAALPETDAVEVFHSKPMIEHLRSHADEILGPLSRKVRFTEGHDHDENRWARIIEAGPRTFHFWCEQPFGIERSLMALFGPTVSFVCGDVAPVQFSDVYWSRHESEHVAAKWADLGTPPSFSANHSQVKAIPYTPTPPRQARARHELGFGPDEIVLATIGNRLGIDMDQPFVDGVAALVLENARLTWLFVGALPDFWIAAFESALGSQFRHIPFDTDLPSLLANVDIFANPFRVGGGNTAVMALEAGAVVLTRGDMGDVPAIVPPAHRAADAESYFDALRALVEDPAVLGAWRAEQGALLAQMLDIPMVEQELGRLCRLAFNRFAARTPVRLEPILAQPKGRQGRRAA